MAARRTSAACYGSAVYNSVTSDDIDATRRVCWGTTDPDQTAAKIWDGENNAGLSFMLFDPPARFCDRVCASDWNSDDVVNAADVGVFLSVCFPDANDPVCNGG